MSASFRVTRAVWIAGKMHKPDETLAIDDPELLQTLLRQNQIEAADSETRERIRSKPAAEWSPYEERPTIGFFDPSRRW